MNQLISNPKPVRKIHCLAVLLTLLVALCALHVAAQEGRGIEHVFEEYNGDHRNRMMGRTGRLANEILPYFWLLLDANN